jgi:hypothetical protein
MGNAKLTRSQAAAVLKLTEDEIKARDGRDLHPQRGRDGSWFYDSAEVTALLTDAAATSASVEEGTLTAASFELFEQGVPLQRVAILMKKSATTIMSLRKQYDMLAGTISFSRANRDRLAAILGMPLGNVGAVIERIADLASRARGAEAHGRQDDEGDDLGELVDPETGARSAISAESADQAVATLRARWRAQAAVPKGSDAQRLEESQRSSSARDAK